LTTDISKYESLRTFDGKVKFIKGMWTMSYKVFTIVQRKLRETFRESDIKKVRATEVPITPLIGPSEMISSR
jgi:hypothetical protein